jgi:hypothetical protein
MVHVYVRPDGLASVIVSDSEYPTRVAHTLLSKVRICLFDFGFDFHCEGYGRFYEYISTCYMGKYG